MVAQFDTRGIPEPAGEEMKAGMEKSLDMYLKRGSRRIIAPNLVE
jgi:hypothetical protein